MKSMISRIIVVVIFSLICSALLMGEDFMYWESNFAPIVLDNITTQDAEITGSSMRILFLSGDVEISADSSTTARLNGPGGDFLRTSYQLSFDGDGVTATGASETNFEPFNQFLVPPVQITYVPDDNDVEVMLRARAANPDGELANAGTYTATQTLTAHWVGP